MKECSKCKTSKEYSDFYKCSAAPDGHNPYCKDCNRIEARKMTEKYLNSNVALSREEIYSNTKSKKCYKCKEVKESIHFNIDIRKKSGLSTTCKPCTNIISKKFRVDNPERVKELNTMYYFNNQDRMKEEAKDYREQNKEAVRRLRLLHKPKRMKEDVGYRMKVYMADIIRKYLKKGGGFKKKNRTEKYLGCKIEHLRKHLESKFKSGMTWENYGKWHIDHIRPASSFDFSKDEEIMQCFNYKNLQPLWAHENIRKSSIYKGKKQFYNNSL